MPSNFLDKYFSYASELCDAPHIFHKIVSRAVLGSACRNNVYYQFGDTKIFNNFWFVLIAPSSFYRKTTAIEIGLKIMDRIDDNYRMPNELTPERIMPILDKRSYGTFFFSEFKTLADILKRDYMAGTDSLLTTLYDVPDVYSRELKNEFYRVYFPTLSVHAATTMVWFINSVRESDIAGGYLIRYLLVVTKHKENTFVAPPVDEIKKNMVVQSLAGIVGAINDWRKDAGKGEGEKPVRMQFEPAAYKEYESWLLDYEKNVNHTLLVAPFYSRLTIYALKFAMIEALNDFSPEIKLQHFHKALEMVEFIHKSLAELQKNELAFTDYEKMRKKVKDAIRSGINGITKKNLNRAVRLSGPLLNGVLSDLLEGEEIEQKKVRVPGADRGVLVYTINESDVSMQVRDKPRYEPAMAAQPMPMVADAE